MITLLLAGVVATPKPLALEVSAASLFKNGYAVVTRQATIDGPGEYVFDQLPQSVLGTFWVTGTAGVKFSEVVSTHVEETTDQPLGSLDDILQANVGKVLTFTFTNDKVETGELVSAAGQVAVVKIATSAGTTVRALQKGAIRQVESQADLVWQRKVATRKRVIRMNLQGPKDGKVVLLSLERGMTWAPNYAVELLDDKRLRLVGKATIFNDLAPIKNIELRLVTGFPNVPYLNIADPLAFPGDMNQWVNSLMGIGYRENAKMAPPMANQVLAGRAFERMDAAFEPSPLPGETSEDLFFYRQPNVTMNPGDRGYYILFGAESDYEHVYEWAIPDYVMNDNYAGAGASQADIWHSVKFKNTANQPLTTGAAIVTKDGNILGQDMMTYTSAGGEANVRITKALDVKGEDFEEEVARDRDATQIRGGYYDKVRVKGTVELTNLKDKAIRLQVTKSVTGELIANSDAPKVRTLGKGLRAVNARHEIEWSVDLEPGKKRTLTYEYSVFVSR